MCMTTFLIGLYGDTARLRYGERDALRVRLLCEMRNLHMHYSLSPSYFDGTRGRVVG